MREIVNWLIGIEELAGDLYSDAAQQFQNDEKLASFLRHLAEDEAWHFHIMSSASQTLHKHGDTSQFLTLDSASKEKIEGQFRLQYEMLSNGTLTKESLLDSIITSEYSEFNQWFIYVVNILREHSKEFKYVASRMQNHLQMIKDTIKSFPGGDKYLEKIRRFPEIWEKRVLVVEDYEPIAEFLVSLFKEESEVNLARNGLEGLNKVKAGYYDLIISDVDMPEMNGISFFNEAFKHDARIKERFIFLSSSPEAEEFSRNNEVHYLRKPFDVPQLKQIVINILNSTKP